MIEQVLAALQTAYPDAKCSLDYASPLQLLVATILSAQCTDERVNKVTPALFARYRTAQDFADASPDELAEYIKSTGFFNNKTRSLIGMGRALVERFGGEVPSSMSELVTVPGAGRKTANVVLGNAFGIEEGVVVDTHVGRISQRLGFTKHKDPVKIERDLMQLVPKGQWTLFPHLMIHHGRAVCTALKPRCEICPVNRWCPRIGIKGTREQGSKGARRKKR
ncbi:MAG: endonuclease III [Gemmatimonadales bacterium]